MLISMPIDMLLGEEDDNLKDQQAQQWQLPVQMLEIFLLLHGSFDLVRR
jgi:surfactin synthase thioesterase subunit